MKKLLLILIIFSGCAKDKDSPDNSTSGSISYKVNGTLIAIDNINFASGEGVAFAKQLKGSVIENTRYLLNAQKGVNNAVITAIVTDSLQQTSYHYDSTNNDLVTFMFTVMVNGQQSMLFYKGDYFDVSISSYKNGRVSGDFSAKITPVSLDYNLRGSVLITDGKLNNIPVTY